ncbi:MAG: hypothetical protein M1817_003541 [Caeruleum heppii]|nr:MAG: hypothetical protein M1817_003541 [Caeruleum heppii]
MADHDANKLLRDRFGKMKGADEIKNNLIEELLEKVDSLSTNYEQASLDREREAVFNRQVQMREAKLKDEVRLLKSQMESNSFVLVLIDGDGMIFQDNLLQKGEQGGKDAAGLLATTVRDYLQRDFQSIPSDCKIVARLYANVKGLAEACYFDGIVPSPAVIEDFARGFTKGRHLFDFIDVGSGKERADNKVSGRAHFLPSTQEARFDTFAEVLKLHLYDRHCRQILFGCSHDNGYAPTLDDYTSDAACAGRITLLEGTPFEKELEKIRPWFTSTKFEKLFRTTKIKANFQHGPSNGQPAGGYHPGHPSAPPPPPHQPENPTPRRIMNPPAAVPLTNGIPDNRPLSTSPKTSNWVAAATRTKSPPAAALLNQRGGGNVNLLPPHLRPNGNPTKEPVVQRNRLGQRIDPVQPYDRLDLKRVKAIKMCNTHYLRGDCQYGDACPHDHGYKPTAAEMACLVFIARMAPCRAGVWCDDPWCIYGHRCLATSGAGKGLECFWGDKCRFAEEMHIRDTEVVDRIEI